MTQSFKAGGRDYPPGRYRVLADEDSDHINLLNLQKKTDDAIPFASRVSPREGKWGEVVFDQDGRTLFLVEVYIVGMDGFFFGGSPGKHKHLVVQEDLIPPQYISGSAFFRVPGSVRNRAPLRPMHSPFA